MKAQDLLRLQYKQAHDTLEAVISYVSAETASFISAGSNLGSIGVIYARTVFAEDQMISGPTGGTAVYEAGGFKDCAELAMPGTRQSQEWSQGTANASDNALAGEIETFGGKQPLGKFLGTIALWHVTSHQGEISAIKGTQGLKGLRF